MHDLNPLENDDTVSNLVGFKLVWQIITCYFVKQTATGLISSFECISFATNKASCKTESTSADMTKFDDRHF